MRDLGFLFCWVLSAVRLVLGRMSEDTEEILPCSIISNRLLISEMEDWDYRKILKVFKLDNPASHESDLLFSDI